MLALGNDRAFAGATAERNGPARLPELPYFPSGKSGRRRFLAAFGLALLCEGAGLALLAWHPPAREAATAAPQVIRIQAVTLPPPLPPLTPAPAAAPPPPTTAAAAPPLAPASETPPPPAAATPPPAAPAVAPPPAPPLPSPLAETPSPAPVPVKRASPTPHRHPLPPRHEEAKHEEEKPEQTAQTAPSLPPSPAAPAAAPAVSAAEAADALSRYAADLRARVQWTLVVPPAIRALGLSGESEVRITLAPDGSLLDVALSRTSGAPLIDRLALSTVKATRFAPFPPELPAHPVTFALRVVIGE